MSDIGHLNLETLYVLNQYFDAFSSITETDMQWIDVLDCLGHEGYSTLDQLKRGLLKAEYPVTGELVFENINRKDFQKWLELLSRKSYKDVVRKKNDDQIEKLKSNIEEKVRSYIEDYGHRIVSLHNFIRYLAYDCDGSFFNVDYKFWKMLIAIKYWFGHFEEPPECKITFITPQIEERQL